MGEYEEYLICKQRGHDASGGTTASIPPQSICARCGTYFYYSQPELVETMNIPEPPKEDSSKGKGK